MVQEISREDLQAKMARNENFILVETLPRESYEGGHIPGALNLPPDELEESAGKVLPNKEADIVLYCGSFT